MPGASAPLFLFFTRIQPNIFWHWHDRTSSTLPSTARNLRMHNTLSYLLAFASCQIGNHTAIATTGATTGAGVGATTAAVPAFSPLRAKVSTSSADESLMLSARLRYCE